MTELTYRMIPYLKEGTMVLGEDMLTSQPPVLVALMPDIYDTYEYDKYFTVDKEKTQAVDLEEVKKDVNGLYGVLSKDARFQVFFGYMLLDERMDLDDYTIVKLVIETKEGSN